LKKAKAKKFSTKELQSLHNIAKDADITNVNQVWTEDITYIMTKNDGFVYLASVMDNFSKKIISYEVSSVMDTNLVLRVLKKALKVRAIGDKGLIIHSDKGAQYRAKVYKKFCAINHLTPSYTRLLYSCADNASQESFHSLLKKEFLFHREIKDLDDAKLLVFEYIDTFYNTKRIHGSIGYISPDEYEKKLAVFNPDNGRDFLVLL
ncbi:MAG: IS3 family transposase, partial [Lachnospiraceae bacterium]|nr:IS3 family transposase [Lachnospiraceae bacterium]